MKAKSDKRCNRCNAELKETDRICLNCGAIISSQENDLYDDINNDEEDNDKEYLDELDELLNSYNKDDIENNSYPDYSSFNDLNENKKGKKNDSINEYNNNFNNPSNNNYENEDDDFDPSNLVKFSDNKHSDENYEYNYEDNLSFNEEDKNGIGAIPFKIVIIVVGVVLLVILLLVIYRFYINGSNKSESYKTNNKDDLPASKYSLEENPNFIKNKTWVCGSSLEDGSLGNDLSTYFQYDFNEDGTYRMQFLEKEDTYESGTYSISLEEIGENNYTYKLTMIAYLAGGYKTRYNFLLNTNKDGTKATYKFNSKVSSCEEMEYFNNKGKE